MMVTQRRLGKNLLSEITRVLDSEDIKYCVDLPLSKHSSFAVGGRCALAAFPKNLDEIGFLVELSMRSDIKYEVIGMASNVLFLDGLYEKMMIFTSQMRQIIKSDDGVIYADAGVNLTSLSVKAAGWGLSGLEFACGIPGSCGGAVYMNAGAFGGEIANVLEYSEYYDVENGKVGRLLPDEHRFSYRHSVYQDNRNLIIIGAGFKLAKSSEDEIRALMDEYTQKRKASQPHEYPNAGSVFKRPAGGFAAKMIDECGLKGLSVGGACVSKKHAGFIVNLGGATSSDVLALIDIIKENVLERFGVELECEIRIIKQ